MAIHNKTLPLDDVNALIKYLNTNPTPKPCQGKGKVLRLQLGYNPNSSSLGTSVVMLLWGMGITTVVLQAVASMLLAQVPTALPPEEDLK